MKMYHLFHMVELSPWPLFMGTAALSLMMSFIFWFKFSSLYLPLFATTNVVLVMLFWFRDINRESLFIGAHSLITERGFQLAMILFIFSEVMFFSSFFWTFFHSSLAPNFDIGINWPPFAIEGISPFEIPLLNTLILLSSGITVTWSHFLTLQNKHTEIPLLFTLILGVYFTGLQFIEYCSSPFSFSDSIFGNIFFMATGFHGLHVIIGSILLFYSLVRFFLNQFSMMNPIGFELSIWYWHFVDVVWLFLFSFVYWWGY